MNPPSTIGILLPTEIKGVELPLWLGRIMISRCSGVFLISEGTFKRSILFELGMMKQIFSNVKEDHFLSFLEQRGDLDRVHSDRIKKLYGMDVKSFLTEFGILSKEDLVKREADYLFYLLSKILHTQTVHCQWKEEINIERFPIEWELKNFSFQTYVELIQWAMDPILLLSRMGGPESILRSGMNRGSVEEFGLVESFSELDHFMDSPLFLFVRMKKELSLATVYALQTLDIVSIEKKASKSLSISESEWRNDRNRIEVKFNLAQDSSYFQLLGVGRMASSKEVRQAYFEQKKFFEKAWVASQERHELQNEVRMILETLEEAYFVLRDNVRKERYGRAIESSH